MFETQLDYLEIQTQVQSPIKKKDLLPTNNFKSIFDEIRNYLAGNAKGITRDETLAQELINILFCKIHDEITKQPEDMLSFYALFNEKPYITHKRVLNYFNNEVKKEYGDVLRESEITLDPGSVYFVVSRLQRYCLAAAERDVIGDAFEAFLGPALRGGEGQFFTPKNVVKMVIDILDPKLTDNIIDPACGSGGFLIMALYDILEKIRAKGDLTTKQVTEKFKKIANDQIRGIDKDKFLSRVTKAYMAIIGDGRGGIFCEDSLDIPENWGKDTQSKIGFDQFDIVMTNPPFGAKIPITGQDKLSQYKLGHVWIEDKNENKWMVQNEPLPAQPPQVLFIERCIQLLKDGGRIGIVLPEGIFGNPSDRYIWEFVFSTAKILAIISVPQETFQPSTHTKTSILFLEKSKYHKDYDIFVTLSQIFRDGFNLLLPFVCKASLRSLFFICSSASSSKPREFIILTNPSF